MGLSFGNNLVSISLIAYKAWYVMGPACLHRICNHIWARKHWEELKEHLGHSVRATQTLRALALLIESGFIYSMLCVSPALIYT